MKILHTSDWHLGKKLDNFSRHIEQIPVLEEISSIAERENVDAVIIASDLFDAYNVQKSNASYENFFFLDEGFGSLDKESLQIVFNTLKTLRNENRIVGIISHVEELQQEVDTHIWVRNSENSGSFIAPNC